MIPSASIDEQLQTHIARVGGGYVKLETLDDADECRLLVHEGSELGFSPVGQVSWRLWDGGHFDKSDLLQVLKGWPDFHGRPLDPRVGVWFKKYKRQHHRITGKTRWKHLGSTEDLYPDILPWEDLERIEIDLDE